MAIVKLENVRLSFANIFEPKAIGEGEPRFSAVFIIDPKQKALTAALDAAIKQVATDKWGTKADGVLKKLTDDGRVCFSRAEKTNASGEVYDGFQNRYSVTASSKTRPVVRDRDASPLTAAEGRPYSGCYVNASIDVWPQDNQWGRRVNATLRWVQFVRDGEAFSGGTPVSDDEFETVGEAETPEL